jgi:glycosyltransferase involved in cell wall biosynthesis
VRVLHVLCDLSGGGAERLVLELCRRAPADVISEVLTLQDGGDLDPIFASAGVRVHRAGRARGSLGLRAFGRAARVARGFDVVHTHLWAGDMWGRPAAWLARVPARLSTEHNVDLDEAGWKTRAKRLTDGFVHRLVAVSPAVKDAIVAQGADAGKVDVIENGVDLSRYAGPREGGGGVLFVGRLAPQKGVDVLIEAAKRLPDVPFSVIGQGPLRDLAAPPNVRWLGTVEDVAPYLARADVVAIPSRWEGFGLAAVEAMAAGAPVVASAVDALPHVLGDAALLVPPADPIALAEALARALSDPGDLSAKGRARAQAFGIDRMVERYVGLWRSLAGG